MKPPALTEPTERQKAFMDCLFNPESETFGNVTKSKLKAGFNRNYENTHLLNNMKSLIIEACESYLAINAPKAVIGLVNVIDDPSSIGNREKLAAIKELLDRVGLVKVEKVEHKVETPAVIFLPPKNDE